MLAISYKISIHVAYKVMLKYSYHWIILAILLTIAMKYERCASFPYQFDNVNYQILTPKIISTWI